MCESSSASESTSSTGPPNPKRRRSSTRIWDLFTPLPAADGRLRARCNRCKQDLTYSKGCTSNLHRHKKRCYPPSSAPSTRLDVLASLRRGAAYAPDSPLFRERMELLTAFIAGEGLPLSLVDSPRFRRFVHALDYRFQVPGRKAFKAHLRRVFQLRADELRRKCASSGGCCLSIDTWTSDRRGGERHSR
jgi:hypothetical protein